MHLLRLPAGHGPGFPEGHMAWGTAWPLDAAPDWVGFWSLGNCLGPGPAWPSVCCTPRREAAEGTDPSHDPVSQSDLCNPVADLVFLGFRDLCVRLTERNKNVLRP